MALNNFYKETTKKFNITIDYNDSTPDITNDTVTFVMKNEKTESATNVLSSEADVATDGASGVAAFTLSKEDTDLLAKQYYYQIVWDLSGGERYVLEDGMVSVNDTILLE